jgi:hypothetical protein
VSGPAEHRIFQTFEGYWVYSNGQHYPVIFAYNHWYQADPAVLRQTSNWVAHQVPNPTLDLPTPEQLNNLIENNQLYVPPPPPATSPEVAVLTTALTPIVMLQGSHPLNIQPLTPVVLTTIAAAVASGSNPPVLAPRALPAPIIPPPVVPLVPVLPAHPPTMTTPLRGVPPSIFDGTRHKSESFL